MADCKVPDETFEYFGHDLFVTGEVSEATGRN
jgi:hypothetical protein